MWVIPLSLCARSATRQYGAVIGEDELIKPALDLAVRARGHAILDDEVRGRITAERERRPLRGEKEFAPLHGEAQLRVLRLVDRLLRSERGHVLALLPDELVDLDLLRLAFDLDRGDRARRGFEHRRHEYYGVARRDDLPLGRD